MKKIFIILFSFFLINSFASGIDDFNQKKYDSAYRSLINDAEAGQAAAMFYIGRIFLEGLSAAPRDNGKGMSYIAKSADKGYEPAIRFLANYYEKSGNVSGALVQYEKLKDKGDVLAIEAIARLNGQIFSKNKIISSQYCNSQESLKILNKSYDEISYLICSLDGKIPGASTGDALTSLRKLVEKSAADNTYIQVIPYLIAKRGNLAWDPALADSLIFKLYSVNPRLLDQLKSTVLKSDIDFELCRFTPLTNNLNDQKIRAAICRIAALRSEQAAVAFVLDRQISGTDGFQQDLIKIPLFLDLLNSGIVKTEFSLKYYQLTNDVASHRKLLAQDGKSIDQNKLNEALNFQLNFLLAGASRNSIKLSEFETEFGIYIDLGTCDVKSKLIRYVDSSYSNSPHLTEPEKLKITNIKNSLLCNSQQPSVVQTQVTSSTAPLVNPSIVLNTNNIPATTPIVPSSSLNTVNSNSVAQINSASINPSSSEFGFLVERCDQKDGNSCYQAGLLLIENKAMPELVDQSKRKDLAYSIFEKGSNLGNKQAKYELFDLIESSRIQGPKELQKLQDLIKEFEVTGDDAGLLRIAYSNVNTVNPLNIIFGGLDGRLSNFCNQIRLIAVKPSLSSRDKAIADKGLATQVCNPTRPK